MEFPRDVSKLMICVALLALGHGVPLNKNTTENKQCIAPEVTEGHTAEMTFFFDPGALSRDDFFAHLRRSDDPVSDIVVCDRHSPVKCNVVSEKYICGNCKNKVNSSLTLQIPNVTLDYDDTYVLQAYADGLPQRPDECRLTVIGKVKQSRCVVSDVQAGKTGRLDFYLRQDILSHQDVFARLIRNVDPLSDIIVCDWNSSVKCDVRNPRYKSTGIVNGRLSIIIPDVTPEFEDTYVFQVYIGRIPEKPDSCKLLLKETQTELGNESDNVVSIVTPFIVVLLLTIVIVIMYLRIRNRQTNSKRQDTRGGDESNISLMWNRSASAHAHERQRWFFANTSREEEKKLLKVRRNGHGSFLIRKRITNPNHFTLSVLFGDEIERFTIFPKEGGFKFLNETFITLCHLVDTYKRKNIKVGDKVFGKLSRPFENELEAEWYFGHINEEDEKKLLNTNEKGSFLIKDGSHVHDYVLVVSVDNVARHFPIIYKEDAYKLLDTGEKFKTLHDLVIHYKEHNFATGDTLCKLVEAAAMKPEEEWLHENYTKEFEIKLLQSSRKRTGYFLIKHSNTKTDHYTLAVYFDDGIRRFPIRRERHGLLFLYTQAFFQSWHELVNYYKENELTVGGIVWGKLTKPFQKVPTESWYFGNITRMDENELLDVNGNGAGSFLIRNGVTNPDDYVLTVKFCGELYHFAITAEENEFILVDEGRTFKALTELVEYYTHHDIMIGERKLGKLIKPFEKKPTKDMPLEVRLQHLPPTPENKSVLFD